MQAVDAVATNPNIAYVTISTVTMAVPGTPGSLAEKYMNNSPIADGIWISTGSLKLDFTIADPNLTEQLKYQVQVSTGTAFATNTIDYTSGLQAQGNVTHTVNGLASNATYYWRVRAIDAYSYAGPWAVSTDPAFKVDTARRR